MLKKRLIKTIKKQIFDNIIKPWLEQPSPDIYKKKEEALLKK